MNEMPEKAATNEASAPPVEQAPVKRAHVGAHARHVAPSKRKSAGKGTRARKANSGRKSAKSPKKATGSRLGSKTAKFLGLLRRSGGATGTDSVRGFISGVLGKKMGLTVTSTKVEDGSRRYALKS